MKNGVRSALVSVAVAAFFLVGGAASAERDDGPGDLASLQRQLPAGLFPAVVHALQAEDADAYRVSRAAASDAVAYRARNAAHGMAVAFAPEGVRVSLLGGADWTWGLALSGYGREGVMRPVSQGRLQASGNRVEYAYAERVTAWYVNGPLGLQQGFTLARRPVGGAGELEVRLALSGAVSAEVSADGRSALLRQVGGGERRRYGGLYVYDAAGRELSARLSSGPGGLSIRVDDRGAQYPIVIDPVIEEAKLMPSDAAPGDEFGYSVSVSGDTVVVGAHYDDDSRPVSGSAYVFEKPVGGWTNTTMHTAKLTASDAAAIDYFGVSVSVSGDTVVVGAYRDDDNGSASGSAYVFKRPSGGWADATQTAKLTASDAAADDQFGYSVSVSGATIVVGAYGDDDNGSASGSAYVFKRPSGGWADATQTAKLTASDGAAADHFGLSVSVSGDTVVVGAYGDDDNGSDSGSAYVFEKPVGGWMDATQTAKLTASDGAQDQYFGLSVSVSGATVVVGAYGDDDNGSASGSAYVFEKPVGGWMDATETAKLTASDAAWADYFGLSVSVSGDTIVVGADRDDDNGSASGSAYVFEKSNGGWTQTAKLTASDGESDDYFGISVSVSGETVVVGAYGNDDNGVNSGSAYVYAPPVLVLRQHPLSNGSGWEITEMGPVEVNSIGGSPYNDQTSSLTVSDGYTVEVFRHANFGGTRLIYYGPRTVDVAELNQHGMNDDTSSYRLYATPPTVTPPSATPSALVLRQHPLSKGSGWEIEIPESVLVPGPMQVRRLYDPYNNQISSLIVADGYSVELFDHWNFLATQLTYHGPQSIDIGELKDHGMDDDTSSYKLYATPTLVLRQHPLSNGSGWEIVESEPVEVGQLYDPHRNEISSLIVGDGYSVELFDHWFFEGTRLTYHGPQSIDIEWLDRYGMDDDTSSYKLYATPPLVLREHGLSKGAGWEIVETGPVDVPAMGSGKGDQVSTIVVSDGYTVEVFRDPNYQGTQLTYHGPRTIRVGELSQNGMNNQISSYKLYATP